MTWAPEGGGSGVVVVVMVVYFLFLQEQIKGIIIMVVGGGFIDNQRVNVGRQSQHVVAYLSLIPSLGL